MEKNFAVTSYHYRWCALIVNEVCPSGPCTTPLVWRLKNHKAAFLPLSLLPNR